MTPIPQIIWVILMAFGLGLMASKHGEDKTGKYSFWFSLGAVLIHAALLWWGGFFGGK